MFILFKILFFIAEYERKISDTTWLLQKTEKNEENLK